MKGWETYTIQKISKRIISGGTPSTTNRAFYNGTIPWLKTQEVNFCNIRNTETFITELGLKNSNAQWIEPNSIVVAMYGNTAAKSAITKISLTTNQACCNITVDGLVADYRFVFYYLYNEYENLKNLANGGAQQNLNSGIIKEFPIQMPPLPIQHRVAEILSALDDKIELNRQINQTLEQMTQAIYKHYFLDDIDPENLPDGWRVAKIGEFAELTKESVNPSLLKTTLLQHYSIPAYDEGQTPKSELGSEILSNKTLVEANTILFSKLNPRFPRIWIVLSAPKNSVCSTEFISFRPSASFYSLLFALLSSKAFKEELVPKATGTSGSHQRIRPADVLDYEIPIKMEVVEELNLQVFPMLLMIDSNIREITNLTKVRDILLPKLISGEILPTDLRPIEQAL